MSDHVHFLDRFLTIEELSRLLGRTDIYLTPYRSREQIVSGALTFAVAAGCPVVSTPYFYAEDLLASGAGRLVPFGDARAMADAVLALLDSPEALAAARAQARRVGAELTWSSVGKATLAVLAEAAALGPARSGRSAVRYPPNPRSGRTICCGSSTTWASCSTRGGCCRIVRPVTASTTWPAW